MATAFDPITTTAAQLREHLRSGTLTSVQIVETYLAQIAAHNKNGAKLNAIISTPPRGNVLEKAQALDGEREAGRERGPLHGIPVIVKDCFAFEEGMGMPTTVGSVVFSREKGMRNAVLIQQLVDQGMIILGTANLTEFCGHKAETMTAGWSAVGGQTLSAYDPVPPKLPLKSFLDSACGGSSSGSAVGVSAGFSPLSIGTETGGSLVYPASKAGLYAMKTTYGSVSRDGAFRISRSFDGIGGMAKTPADLAVLVEGMLVPEAKFGGRKFKEAMTGSWKGVRVGIVESTWGGADQEKWGSEPVKSRYASVAGVVREGGGFVVFPADAPSPDTIKHDGKTGQEVSFYEFNSVIQEFCAQFQDPKVKNLADIIKFNEENAAVSMPEPHPDQKELINSFNSTLTDESSDAIRQELKRLAGMDGIDKFMAEIGVDLIVSNSDCSLIGFTSGAGYPSATVPLGQLDNGLPYGMFILARAGEEEKMFEFMSAFEKTMPGVEPPVLRSLG